MNKRLKKLTRSNEFYILLVIIVLSFIIQIRSGQFFTGNNLVDIVNATVVPGIFAIGAFMVIVSGGIDVSFPALASLSVYATTRYLTDIGYNGSFIVPLLMVCGLGALLGSVNGIIISKFKLPTLIVTLGTQSVFRGIMQGSLNSVQIPNIPVSMKEFGSSSLFTATNTTSGLSSNMPLAVLFLVGILIVVFLLLRYTMFGRAIYATGGDENSASRAGFNVPKTKFWLYVLVGVISSIAGLIRTSMMGQMHPTNLLGMEMMVIASVVLGGTAITGGRGTLTGAMLGTVLITIVQSSLLLLGIDTFWQGFFLGLLIIVGTGISAMQVHKASNKLVGIREQ